MVKCDTSSTGIRRMNRVHAFFMELLLYGVTKGKLLFPVLFPPRWHFLEGRGCWVWPSGVWEYSRGGDDTVSLRPPATGEEQAGPAARLVAGEGDAWGSCASRLLW